MENLEVLSSELARNYGGNLIRVQPNEDIYVRAVPLEVLQTGHRLCIVITMFLSCFYPFFSVALFAASGLMIYPDGLLSRTQYIIVMVFFSLTLIASLLLFLVLKKKLRDDDFRRAQNEAIINNLDARYR